MELETGAQRGEIKPPQSVYGSSNTNYIYNDMTCTKCKRREATKIVVDGAKLVQCTACGNVEPIASWIQNNK